MEDGKWLQPDVRRLVRLLVVLLAFLWLLLAGFRTYASVWWQTHGILDKTLVEWFGDVALMSLVFVGLFAFSWFSGCRVAWQVGPEGVVVYRGGTMRRSFAWSEVVSMRVLPFGVIAQLSTRPFVERLHWLAVADAAWLRDFVRGQMGERV
jgi:hypothetical protein